MSAFGRLRRRHLVSAAAGFTIAGLSTAAVLSRLRRGSASGHPISRHGRAARNSQLAKLGVQVGTTYATTSARKIFASTERRIELDRKRELKTADQIADRLGHMKGALMKLGQMASYLDEGLPEPLRAALSQLQSNAPPMSAELAIQAIER
ncbi:MAG: hypothetical protein F2659_00230, partial [Actinobacteria bacterium]|nr:hypothetical protein [Actinomycetota bacterium]